MALADALDAERNLLPGPKCGVAKVRIVLVPADQTALDAALADDATSHSAISRALFSEGHRVSEFTVGRHRMGKCSCGAR